jgi:hypothetical protein
MITSLTTKAISKPERAGPLRGWRAAVGLAAVVAGATVITGALLPWVEAFGGLMQLPGIRGGNGRILAGVGILLVIAGLWHIVRSDDPSRWLIGVAGFGSAAFSGYLLIRLSESVSALAGDSMVIARGGPGLWVTAAGSLVAFATLFLPPSSQTTLRRPGASSFLDWAADRESAGPRRALQISLGLVWLFDAGLQYQPAMFGKAFVTQVLDPAAMGNPIPVANVVMGAGNLIAHNVAAWNAAFATTQLVLAAGLLFRPTVKAALAGTVAWSLAVWLLGEGLGGLLTGTASPVTGAPGAAILYALVAILAWPASSGARQHGSVAATSPLGSGRAKLVWLGLWGSFAYLVLQPANRAPLGLRDILAGLAAGEPGWIATADRVMASAVGSHGAFCAVVMAIIFAIVAVAILIPAANRPVLAVGILAALVIWVAGENFGGTFTGTATDPNTGPLLILIAVAYWPRSATQPDRIQANSMAGQLEP